MDKDKAVHIIGISSMIYRNSKDYKTRIRKDRLLSVSDAVYVRCTWLVKFFRFLRFDRLFGKSLERIRK